MNLLNSNEAGFDWRKREREWSLLDFWRIILFSLPFFLHSFCGNKLRLDWCRNPAAAPNFNLLFKPFNLNLFFWKLIAQKRWMMAEIKSRHRFDLVEQRMKEQKLKWNEKKGRHKKRINWLPAWLPRSLNFFWLNVVWNDTEFQTRQSTLSSSSQWIN